MKPALKNWFSMACALVALVTTTASHADKFYYVHNDPLGTPQVITDENKNVVWEVDRDPWGNITNVIVDNLPNNVSLPGMYADAETGYSDNGWRPYDSSGGQYLQSDPIGQAGGLNTYLYANANPVMNTDFFGLAPGQHYSSYGDANKEGLFDVMSLGMLDGNEWGFHLYEAKESNGCSYWSYTLSTSGAKTFVSPPPIPNGAEPQGVGHNHPDEHSVLSEYGNSASGGSGDKGAADESARHKHPEPIYMIDESGHVQGYFPNKFGDDRQGQTKDWPSRNAMPSNFPF